MSLKLAEDAEDVILTHDHVFNAIQLDFAAGIFSKKDAVADLNVKLYQLAVVAALACAEGDDKVIPLTVKKGDKVLISKYGGTEIKIDGDMYLIMREDDILGIIG